MPIAFGTAAFVLAHGACFASPPIGFNRLSVRLAMAKLFAWIERQSFPSVLYGALIFIGAAFIFGWTFAHHELWTWLAPDLRPWAPILSGVVAPLFGIALLLDLRNRRG